MFKSFKKFISKRSVKNFLEGYRSAFDLFPSKPFPRVNLDKLNFQKTSGEAIRRDWEAIGKDLQKAMDIIKEEIDGKKV